MVTYFFQNSDFMIIKIWQSYGEYKMNREKFKMYCYFIKDSIRKDESIIRANFVI